MDIFMNFAGILIISEIDNTVGSWWKTNLTPLKGHMTVQFNLKNDYHYTMMTAWLCKYTSWSFALVISGTFLYGYCHQDRMILCKGVITISIVTMCTLVIAPLAGLCVRFVQLTSSTPLTDLSQNLVLFTLPRNKDGVVYPRE